MALSFRTPVTPVAIVSATGVGTGQTVAVGDFAIASLMGAGSVGTEITSVTGFTDSAGNTIWTFSFTLGVGGGGLYHNITTNTVVKGTRKGGC